MVNAGVAERSGIGKGDILLSSGSAARSERRFQAQAFGNPLDPTLIAERRAAGNALPQRSFLRGTLRSIDKFYPFPWTGDRPVAQHIRPPLAATAAPCQT